MLTDLRFLHCMLWRRKVAWELLSKSVLKICSKFRNGPENMTSLLHFYSTLLPGCLGGLHHSHLLHFIHNNSLRLLQLRGPEWFRSPNEHHIPPHAWPRHYPKTEFKELAEEKRRLRRRQTLTLLPMLLLATTPAADTWENAPQLPLEYQGTKLFLQ